MDEKEKREEGSYEEKPATFEIHPEDVMIIQEDFDLNWEDENSKNETAEEHTRPFEAFEEKVLRGLEILSEIKDTLLDKGEVSKGD